MTRVYRLTENIYRIRHWNGREPRESLLSRYGIIDLKPDGAEPELLREDDGASVSIENGYTLSFSLSAGEEGGFDIRLPLDPGERLYGLGDESRECIEKHGRTAVIKQENVRSYGPVPYLMSSRGWAVLVNCTYAHTFDIAASETDMLRIYGDKGALDIIVFCGRDLRGALFLAGKVAGRPVMLPKAAYGLTFVLNEQTTARTLLDDALRFRDRKIPCDILGLEPSWMSKHYDASTGKKWDADRFYIPHWKPENYYGSWSFIWNLNKMGCSLSLWLCCNYDLFWKEEEDVLKKEAPDGEDAVMKSFPKNGHRMDTVTKPGEDWFEHLKKFVDNGAEAFKLDGSEQVIPFPDRIWAGRYTDDEIRNLYPAVYAKQMKEGYERHTGKRAMIYTCGVYPGTQKYAATWAGDTGSGAKVLLSLMNYAMCGHSNTSFDMSMEKESIHFGFLAPWSQHLGWDNWLYPWYNDEEHERCYRYYAQLRSSLFPYLYSAAHTASSVSLPMLRPLSLTYQDTGRYDEVFNEYMLGDALLVAADDDHVILPEEDEWYDFFSGVRHSGSRDFTYVPESPACGALFVRAGSIVVMQDWVQNLKNNRPDRLYVHVYPGKDAEFELYEDDYTTYGYEKGEYAVTKMVLSGGRLKIYPRKGSYPGMPDEAEYTVIWHNEDGTTEERQPEMMGE